MTATRVIVTGQSTSDAAIADEVRAAAPDAVLEALGDGVWLVTSESPSEVGVVARWRERPPMFVRHVCPVDVTIALRGDESDATSIARAAAEVMAGLSSGEPASVQTRVLAGSDVSWKPYLVNEAVAAAFPPGVPLDVRRPAQVVSVVVSAAPGPHGALTAYVGRSSARDNLSAWAGGNHRLAKDDAQVSRAEAKLVEAMELFALEAPAGGRAVDLGAAPGGWSRVLRARGLTVEAVDPAELDPRLRDDRGITWRPTTAERWLATGPAPVDVAVADMKMDARDAARLMRSLASLVRGWAVLTLKLPSHDQARVAHAALAILEPAWRIAGARQLFHNRSEVTVALRPR